MATKMALLSRAASCTKQTSMATAMAARSAGENVPARSGTREKGQRPDLDLFGKHACVRGCTAAQGPKARP
jgi:hypothetical protein